MNEVVKLHVASYLRRGMLEEAMSCALKYDLGVREFEGLVKKFYNK